MSRALLLIAAAFTVAPPALAGFDSVLTVDPASNVVATLDSISAPSEAVAVSGSVPIHVELVAHPQHGLVASSIELSAGDLDIADLTWSLSGRYETLNASFVGGSVRASSDPIPATPVAANTSEIPLIYLTLLLNDGFLDATGQVVTETIDIHTGFSGIFARPITVDEVGTIVTTPVDGGVQVTLTIPIAQAEPLSPPLLVAWLRVEGPLVLAGTGQPPAVPASPHAVWLGALLLAGGWLAARGWHARARRGEPL